MSDNKPVEGPGSLALEVVKGAGSVARQIASKPDSLVNQPAKLMSEWGQILLGQSELAPKRGEKRFRHKIWQSNVFYKRLMQGHLALADSVDTWVDELGLEPRNRERTRLVTSNLVDAMAPTNFLLGNPEAMQKALETGGTSLLQGGKNLVGDLRNNGAMPSQVDEAPFQVGSNLATTPGKVVFRNEMLELIQYRPSTEKTYSRPLLMVPPQINKFYVYDIAPGRSMIEYAVGQGFQVFAVSWRNPGSEHKDWSFQDYVLALEKATEVVSDISGRKDLNVLGSCSGGITLSTLVAYLAAKGSKRIHSMSLMVSVLDSGEIGDTALGLFAQREVLELARLTSSRKGLLDGKQLGKVFAMLRPNDLIWSYWVNNYLLGNAPPAFDILYWNNDTTNLPAALHRDFLKLIEDNPLARPGKLVIDGVAIDLAKITCDAFILAGSTDHITPWKACYRSVGLLGGKTEFVLSSSGHIQALINPVSNAKARFRTTDKVCSSAEEFETMAREQQGSWWSHWQGWLAKRSGKRVAVKAGLGSKDYPAVCDAPGRYVKERHE